MDDEGRLGTARLEIVDEVGDDADIVTIFATADNDAIDLAITNERIEGPNELGSVPNRCSAASVSPQKRSRPSRLPSS